MKVVQKYGGSSVATINQIKDIAKHIKNECSKKQMIIVASAMGKSTNNLIEMAHLISAKPNKKDLDFLLNTGEMQTVALLSLSLKELGVKSICLTGFQAGILTNNQFSKAFILKINKKRIQKFLDKGYVVCVAGFQGTTNKNELTTLGRGGSDTTAVALAGVFECLCEIYTDVDCIHSIDPQICKNSKKIKFISYEEMMEFALCGAKVIDTRAIELAKKYNVKVFLGNALKKNFRKGTYIMNTKKDYFEKMPIKGIAIKKDICTISINISQSRNIKFDKVIDLIASSTLNLDMISKINYNNQCYLSFNCDSTNLEDILQLLQKYVGLKELEIKRNLTKISLIGIGLATHTGILNSAIKNLVLNKIDIIKVSTSETTLSLLINSNETNLTVETLSEIFNLKEER